MPSLQPVTEGTETLTPLDEAVYSVSTRFGFFPGSSAQSQTPYPFPGSSAYPGDTVTDETDAPRLTAASEGSETLTPLGED